MRPCENVVMESLFERSHFLVWPEQFFPPVYVQAPLRVDRLRCVYMCPLVTYLDLDLTKSDLIHGLTISNCCGPHELLHCTVRFFGATIQTAEGNDFTNAGRDTIKITVQNFIDRHTVAPESEQTSGGNIVEDNQDLLSISGS